MRVPAGCVTRDSILPWVMENHPELPGERAENRTKLWLHICESIVNFSSFFLSLSPWGIYSNNLKFLTGIPSRCSHFWYLLHIREIDLMTRKISYIVRELLSLGELNFQKWTNALSDLRCMRDPNSMMKKYNFADQLSAQCLNSNWIQLMRNMNCRESYVRLKLFVLRIIDLITDRKHALEINMQRDIHTWILKEDNCLRIWFSGVNFMK